MSTTAATAPTNAPAPKHFASPQSHYNYDGCSNQVFCTDKRQVGWMIESAWSKELGERNNALTSAQYATLISAVRGEMPVVLTTVSWFEGRRFHDTKTVIVTDLAVSGSTSADSIQVRYWGGFDHAVRLNSIVDVTTPDTTLTLVEQD